MLWLPEVTEMVPFTSESIPGMLTGCIAGTAAP